MGWSIGYDEHWKRDIGYGVPAWCDHPDCNEEIDRGLSYVCGNEPYGGDDGCGLYFCGKHLMGTFCERCAVVMDAKEDGEDDAEVIPFDPKPDHPRWLHHKATDPSWAEWRAEQASALR